MKKATWSKIVILTLALVFAATLSFAADPQLPVQRMPPTTPTKTELIDINTATKAELSTHLLIGDINSQKIIDGRPYVRKDQLKSKKILSDYAYDQIKDKIIVKQASKKR